MRLPVDCRLVLLFLGVLAGCGGGGGGRATPAAPARGGGGSTALTVRINVPLSGTASNRRPAYISPAPQSLAIVVEAAGGAAIGTFSFNVTPASPSCQTGTVNLTPTLTCSLSLPLALPAGGSYVLAATTYDQPQTQQCSPTGAVAIDAFPPCG